MPTILETQNLTFSYQGAPDPALRGISLEIEDGSFVAVLGHNGSGKSTFAKHLNAILLPEGGSVYVLGMDSRDAELLLEIRRTVGMVFQNPDNQIVANVVEDDVAFAPENLGLPPEDIRRRVDHALKLVGMSEYTLHAPHLLSGGQKQRIAIAGVLAMRPRCIVLDEPTAMLDPVGRDEVVGTVKRICRQYGMTVVLITHHMNEAAEARRLIVMAHGRIVGDGPPAEIFANAELLKEAGLDVPDTVKLLMELKKAGMNVPPDAISVEECTEAVYMAMGGGA